MTDSIMGVAGRLAASADSLAALGALIRIESEQLPADPEVHAVLKAIGAELLGAPMAVTPESAAVLGLAQTFFAQGAELLRNPGRTGGWDQVDVGVLQGIGRMSMSVAEAIRAASERTPALADQLSGSVRILDVGTGTGWLAIALARTFPQARVVGIDIFPPALAGTFAPGGPGRLAELLMDLRTVRSGGRPWVAEELLPVLAQAGLVDASSVQRTWSAPVNFYLACRAT